MSVKITALYERLSRDDEMQGEGVSRPCPAFAEVISYNRANLERVEQNKSRQQDRQQSRTKRREEEI